MPKFILLDHSLRGVGGHHYTYDVDVLRAAEALGHEIVLATNVNFRAPTELPKAWRLLPVFRRDLSGDYSVWHWWELALRDLDTLHPRPRSRRQRLWDRLHTAMDRRNLSPAHRRQARLDRERDDERARERSRLVHEYSEECAQVFQAVGIDSDDKVFIPTVTEFDLERLVVYLSRHPQSRLASWHLQFHFNFLSGREPDYARQENQIEAMRRLFADLLGQVPRHRMFFYTTTHGLADQYQRLGVGTFQALPYPINSTLQPSAKEQAAHGNVERVRVTCAGSTRPEKCYNRLDSAIQQLWSDYFAANRLQLLIQTESPDFSVSLPSGQKSQSVGSVAELASTDSPVVFVRGPLPVEDYARLIRTTDVGLFLYDSERYYTRCSGVLVEMLSAGIPVIVPAGCWLSAQIAEHVYHHVDRLLATLPIVSRYRAGQMPWQTRQCSDASRAARGKDEAQSPSPPIAFGNSANSASCTLPIPAGATEFALTASWPDSPAPGVYVRLSTCQFDREGNQIQKFSTILEQRTGNQPASALVHLKPGVDRVQLSLENAFNPDVIELAAVECRFLAARGAACPAGAVGLIAADLEQLPELLADLTQNHSHYRATAMTFGRTWNKEHQPARTVVAIKSNHEQRVQTPERQQWTRAA